MIRTTIIEEFFHPVSNYVVPIYAFADKKSYAAGTAVIIAPGLAVTASHVLRGLFEHFGYDSSQNNIELDIYLTQFNTGATWYVSNSATWVGTDISVLSLIPRNGIAEETALNPLQITVDPPNKSDAVIAYGYPKTELDVSINNSEQTNLQFKISPTLSEGVVTDVHYDIRDRGLLRFPCFEVNAEYSAGMSGGAIFNQERELCGLVCVGGQGELINNSYAVSIWPISIISVTISENMPSHDNVVLGTEYKMLELAKLGYISMSGHERIEFFTHDNGSDGVRRKHKV